eukprot:COSAG06_NODE_759_length_12508_cov_9.809171_10_plen_90_part_00
MFSIDWTERSVEERKPSVSKPPVVSKGSMSMCVPRVKKPAPQKPPVALNSPYALVLLDIVALSLSRQVIVVLPDQHNAEDGNATNKTEG